MTLAYFDCFAGAAGDMIVAALVDAGADRKAVEAAVTSLPGLDGSVGFETAARGGMAGTLFTVTETGHAHRSLADILQLIEAGGLPPRVTERSRSIFQRLAGAEAAVHQVSVEDVHFHEVGAVDSIADIVAACVALESLNVDDVRCGAVPVGSGTVTCAHGELPLPAPATAALLKGFDIVRTDSGQEMTTPTAAAFFAALAESSTPLPAMRVDAVGYGAGTRDSGSLPNLLRVFVGETSADGHVDSLVELATNLDDCPGTVIGATIEKLLAAGCRDAWAAPIVMKRSRPAWTLSALCDVADVPRAEQIIFSETTTLGIRRRPCHRTTLLRRHETVQTPYGPIRVKVGALGEADVTARAEFSDCRDAAEAHHVPIKDVIAAAESAFRQGAKP